MIPRFLLILCINGTRDQGRTARSSSSFAFRARKLLYIVYVRDSRRERRYRGSQSFAGLFDLSLLSQLFLTLSFFLLFCYSLFHSLTTTRNKNTIESKSRITAFAERILRCITGDGLDSGIKYRQGTSKLDDRESKGSRKDSR